MTPLPSVYKGYHCRSRLEARWLCFLDTIGMQFIYEPEGFKFEDGTCYLPDLYFPVIETWGEIKPAMPDPQSEEGQKIVSLVIESGKPLIILDGSPDFRPYHQVRPPEDPILDTRLVVGSWDKYWWPVSLDIYKFRKYYFDKHESGPRLYFFPEDMEHDDYSVEYHNAIHASRFIRFDTH